MAEARLHKLLAQAGLASRREAERWVAAGRVEVNGRKVTEPGAKADPTRDRIRVDGRPLRPPRRPIVLLLYKPRGYVSTLKDPQGRPTVLDLVPGLGERVFHVGRLDFNTEGLLLLTNDGELAHRIAHPSHGCEKGYLAKVSGVPGPDALERLRRGIVLDGRRTAPAAVELVRSTRRDGNAWLALTLREGRSHEVRGMLAAVGHPVSKLKRVRIGPLEAGSMRPGEVRELAPAEVRALVRSAAAGSAPAVALRPPRAPRARRDGQARRVGAP